MTGSREVSARLPKDARALEVARRFVAEQLAGQAAGDVHDAKLLVSELVTAVILRGRPPRTVSVVVDEQRSMIRIAVGDGDADPSDDAPPFVLERLGHEIVSSVADRWGTEVDPAGRIVLWSEMDRSVTLHAVVERSTTRSDV